MGIQSDRESRGIFQSQEGKMLMKEDCYFTSFQTYAEPLKEALRQKMLNQEGVFRRQVHELHQLYRTQKTLMNDCSWEEFDGYNLGKQSSYSMSDEADQPRCEVLVTGRTLFKNSMEQVCVGSSESIKNGYLYDCRERLQQRPQDLHCNVGHYVNYIDDDLSNIRNGRECLNNSLAGKHYFCQDNVYSVEKMKLSLSIGGAAREKDGNNRAPLSSSQHIIDLESSSDISNEDAKPQSSPGCASYYEYMYDSQVRGPSTHNYLNSWKRDSLHGINMGGSIKSNLFSSQHIIDLEESSETISNEDAKPKASLVCASKIPYCEYVLDSEVRGPSTQNYLNSWKRDRLHRINRGQSPVGGSKSSKEPTPFSLPICCYSLPLDNTFVKDRSSISFEAKDLDLNKDLPDEFSFDLNDPVAAFPSTGSSSCFSVEQIGKVDACPTPLSWSGSKSYCSSESSVLVGQNAVNPGFVNIESNSNSRSTSEQNVILQCISERHACPTNIVSMLGTSLDLNQEPDYSDQKDEHQNVNFQLDVGGSSANVDIVEFNSPKVEVDRVSLHECDSQDMVEDTCREPASCNLDSIPDDNLSSIMTMHSGAELRGSNLASSIKFQSLGSRQIAETSYHEDPKLSNEALERQCDVQTGELAEAEVLIQKAALALICLSMQISFRDQDCTTKAGSSQTANKERDQPQRSSDSYELFVLNQKPISEDDYCVSSKPLKLSEMDKKDSGIKLTRGRRMKDFQRDILPGLASLSRHEICEDINIMDSVIRSREYKKLRSKMAGGGKWFSPVRCKRSRLNYVGRRYYS